MGAALLVAATAAATGCSEPLPTSLLAASPTATAIAGAPETAETPVAGDRRTQPAPAAPPTPTAVPVEIGSKRQLFVDDWLVAVATSTTLVLHRPRAAEVVLRLEEPWEDTTAAYFTVFKDGDLYRMYYRCHNDANETTCYAESADGIHWEKPSLGLFPFEGSTENNIVWSGPESHNFAAFVDTNPDRRPEEKYKALGGQPPIALVSPDGINWTRDCGRTRC